MNIKTLNKIAELVPDLQKIAHRFLPECDKFLQATVEWSKCTCEITDGKRDIYLQAGLYTVGRRFNTFSCLWEVVDKTKCVTWTLTSKHLSGQAFDIAIVTDKHVATWPNPEEEKNKAMWLQLASIGKSMGLYPGAMWTTQKPDWPHYSLIKE